MKQGMSLRTSQQLTLTPQLQQSIRLLQLSTLELTQEVQQHLTQNPFLEADPETPLENLSDQTGDADRDRHEAADLDNGRLSDEGATLDSLAVEGPLMPDWAELGQAPAYDASAPWDGQDADGGADLSVKATEFEPEPSQPFEVLMLTGAANARSQGDLDDDWLDSKGARVTLQDHLRAQCEGRLGDPMVLAGVRFLIDCLDDNGLLDGALEALAGDFSRLAKQSAGVATPEFDAMQVLSDALEILQEMDPLGVGAEDLPACLRLQLLARLSPPNAGDRYATATDPKTVALALSIIKHPLELVAKRDYRQLAKLCKAPVRSGASATLAPPTELALRAACELIRTLEPKPARAFADSRTVEMLPDVVVRRNGRQLEVHLNRHVMPRLRVNDFYTATVLADKSGAQATLQQALVDARWFVKSIAQRFDTILRVSRCIVDRQHAFFDKGPLALKPMVLREVADELGLHESTISRVTTAKFMATPIGTFELKYFFTSGLHSVGGKETSSTAVRELIRQWVDNENPKKPLSDQKLAEMLSERGIECARRTVAKYREALKIAPTSLRRSHS
jgi:RNA polymerase sigma-54 factor